MGGRRKRLCSGGALFADAPDHWRDAQDFGIRHGWSQSSFNAHGAAGMLSLVRGQGRITPMELKAKEQNMRWLVSLTHLSLSRVYLHHETHQPARLTQREIEAMKWTADGKSAQEISDILNITKHAVDFHLKNAIQRLQTSNKTAAVARAAVLGLLN
jgi:DNA-binding CsgD family transcriptional regulator